MSLNKKRKLESKDVDVKYDKMVDTTVMFWRGEENDNRVRMNHSMSSLSCTGIPEEAENRVLETFQDFSGNTHTVI